MSGHVVHGKALGRTVGMPTANLQLDFGMQLPEAGVYAAFAFVKGEKYLSVTNIGTRPSVDDSSVQTIESFLLDFDGDLYGESMQLTLIDKIRGIRKMDSLSEVQKQVEKDILVAREMCKLYTDAGEEK